MRRRRSGQRALGPALALAAIGAALLAAAAGLGVVLWLYLAPPGEGAAPGRPAAASGQRLALGDLLGVSVDPTRYPERLAPRAFVFPRDHGSHPDYRTEWWYFTGNLASAEGRRFGYQLTFFRTRVGVGQAYLGHLAVTDVESGRFHSFERLGRAGLGTAGAEAAPFRVWLDAWEIRAIGAGNPRRPRWALRARAGEVSLALELQALKPVVLQGEAGLSRRSDRPFAGSYYYSVPRWETTGEVTVGEGRWAVGGASWLDREWSNRALGPEQVGWDWFGLHLDDGTDVMFYALREASGARHPASAGALIGPHGRRTALSSAEVRLDVLDRWEGPEGARYPSRWRLGVGGELVLEVTPLVPDQLARGLVAYWEGAVAVRGRRRGRPVTGTGYVELTGYDRPRR